MARNTKEEEQETKAPAKEGGFKFVPFTTKEELPKFKVLSSEDQKKGAPMRVALGEPRFICNRQQNTVKVIAIYRHRAGVLRKMWSTLKLSKKRPGDIATYEKLKAARIPGAY